MWGNNGCIWVIILILLFACGGCGCGNNAGGCCNNGCGNDCGCNNGCNNGCGC